MESLLRVFPDRKSILPVALVKRLVGILLALAGLVPLALGTWFAVKLGPSGEATFSVADAGTTPVVFGPEFLNRTDMPVRIDAGAKAGGGATAVIGAPSDVAAVFGDSEKLTVERVQVQAGDWTATTARSGSGATPDLEVQEVFRSMQDLGEKGRVTISQDTAPETLVIVPRGDGLLSLTATWTRDTWFYQALVLAAAGGLLTTVGWLLARPTPKSKRDAVDAPARTAAREPEMTR